MRIHLYSAAKLNSVTGILAFFSAAIILYITRICFAITMSMPNIPDVDATINITLEDSVNLLLASVAFEELGLAHIINAEAEKIQYILGTLEGQTPPATTPTIAELMEINRSVERTLRNVLKNQMLLQFKLEDTIPLIPVVITLTEPA